ncbi:MAG: hypothetical protein M1817_002029 [Caeruleum heppii]|nr:MAG: hypothetical protein M1817_002029 [Caeruleum heppii]
MTVGIASHLVSRALQDGQSLHAAAGSGDETIAAWQLSVFGNREVSSWALPVFATTVSLYLILIVMVTYTYGGIVATLTMIESRNDRTYLEVPTDAHEKSGKDASEMESGSGGPPVQYITSSIRGTMKHLRARAGRLSRFRGFGLFVCNAWLLYQLNRVLFLVLPFNFFVRPYLAAFCATMLLAPLDLTLTHIIMSEPSPKPWFRRVPGRTTWVKVLPATALNVAVMQLWITIPYVVFTYYCKSTPAAQNLDDLVFTSLVGAAIGLVVLIGSWFWMVLPVSVILARVQASLLPETDEAIVPFDRTFDGMVVLESSGGRGKLGLGDAWRSFTWADRRRLLKLYGKVIAIQIAVGVLFCAIYFAEYKLLVGSVTAKETPSISS